MLLTYHVVLTHMQRRKEIFAIQTIVSQFDLFLTISQETFQVHQAF
jgi:hypothetical protein